MKMKALKNIYSSVGTIEKGSDFHEINPFRIEELIATGDAERSVADAAKATAQSTEVSEQARVDHDAAQLSSPASAAVAPKFALDWTGGTAVVICSGPSLSAEQCANVKRWQRLEKGRYVVVVNTSFRRAPFADVLYACDDRWWKAKEKDVSYFDEASRSFRLDQMWTQDVSAAKNFGIQLVNGVLGPAPSHSGYQACGLAALAGVKEIILLGMDMQGTHWHGDHPAGIRARLPFKQWLNNANKLAADMKAAGIKVVNSTPNSALKVFPFVELKESLCLPFVPSVPTPSTVAKPSFKGSNARGTT